MNGVLGSKVTTLAPCAALAPYVHAIVLRRPCAQAPALPRQQRFPAQWRSALTVLHAGEWMDEAAARPLAGAALCGPRLHPGVRRYAHNPVVSTVLFQPGVLSTWLGEANAPREGQRLPAAPLLGNWAVEQLMQVYAPGKSTAQQAWALERWLMPQLLPLRLPAFPALPAPGLLFDVQTWADGLGCSVRQLQRRVQALQGLSPKALLRVLRMQQGVRGLYGQLRQAAGNGDLEGLARDAGFSDGAHLSRELRALAGVTPRGLQRLLRGGELQPWLLEPQLL